MLSLGGGKKKRSKGFPLGWRQCNLSAAWGSSRFSDDEVPTQLTPCQELLFPRDNYMKLTEKAKGQGQRLGKYIFNLPKNFSDWKN